MATFAASTAACSTSGVSFSSNLRSNSSSSCRTSSSLKASIVSPPPQRFDLCNRGQFQCLHFTGLLSAQCAFPDAIAKKPFVIRASPAEILVELVLLRVLFSKHPVFFPSLQSTRPVSVHTSVQRTTKASCNLEPSREVALETVL